MLDWAGTENLMVMNTTGYIPPMSGYTYTRFKAREHSVLILVSQCCRAGYWLAYDALLAEGFKGPPV